MRHLTPRAAGTLLCALSAASYGAAAIFGKLAYDEGLTVSGLLAGRFTIAAAVLWGIVALVGGPLRASRRGIAAGLVIGLGVYAAQAGFFFGALARLDAALAVLLVYVMPVIVATVAWATGRERLTGVKLLALPLSLVGVGLVLAGAGVGTVDGVGVAFALLCALFYAGYVLIADLVVGRIHPITLTAAVCTGCAIAFVVVAGARGELPAGEGAAAWVVIVALALLSTVVAISALAAGLTRVGPSTASIVATIEPVVAAGLAFLIFDERLGPVQVIGGTLVIAAVLVLNLRSRRGVAKGSIPV